MSYNPGWSRRQIAGIAASSAFAVAVRAASQEAPPVTSQSASPRDFLQEARDGHRENSGVLAAFPLPMSLEPAFQFKA